MEDSKAAYSLSYIDRFLAWIDRSRYPSSIIYLVLFTLVLLSNQTFAWIEGSSTFGRFDPDSIANAVWPIFALGLIHHLDRMALTASRKFRPAASVSEDVYEDYVGSLISMPSRPVLILSLIAPLLAIFFFASESGPFPITERSTFAFISFFFRFVSAFIFFPVVVYHTIRQLRYVSRFHGLAKELDLFLLEPLYAFSRLTSRTGIGWIIIVSLYLLMTSYLGAGGFAPSGFFWWLITFMEILLAILAFLLPLLGMHNLMAEEKVRLNSATDQRLKAAFALLDSKVDRADHKDARGVKDMISSLVIERELIEKIPTWPWQGTTLRGFISAILIPILLLVFQLILDRLIQF